MASRSYYSIPSNKTRKILNTKKTTGRPLTIEETKKQIEHVREKKREKKKQYFKENKSKQKYNKVNDEHKKRLLTISKFSDICFNDPSKMSMVINTLNNTYPSHSNVDYEKIFLTYFQLLEGGKISYNIDSEVLQALMQFITKHKPNYTINKSILSLEIFFKTNTCPLKLAKYLNQTARRFHITAKF